ncbi:MAG: holin family protein [Oscillospiraceae bacterium]
MRWDTIIKSVSGAIGAVVGFMFGEVNGLFVAIIALMVLDYITGILCAIITKTLSSEVGFRGLVKKFVILIVIAVGHLVDAYVVGTGSAVMSAVMLFFAANEGISILENAAILGLPIPKKLKDVLEQLKDKDGEE